MLRSVHRFIGRSPSVPLEISKKSLAAMLITLLLAGQGQAETRHPAKTATAEKHTYTTKQAEQTKRKQKKQQNSLKKQQKRHQTQTVMLSRTP